MKRWFKSVSLGAAALVALAGMGEVACRVVSTGAAGEVIAKAMQYRCPMHPSYVSDKPGNCPICGMKLVPVEPSPAAAAAPMAAAAASPASDRSALQLSPERRYGGSRWSAPSARWGASPWMRPGCTTSTRSTRPTWSTCTSTSRASSCAGASRCSRSTAPI